jgi:hypothetical protein
MGDSCMGVVWVKVFVFVSEGVTLRFLQGILINSVTPSSSFYEGFLLYAETVGSSACMLFLTGVVSFNF